MMGAGAIDSSAAPEFCPQVHPNWVKLSGAFNHWALESVRAQMAKLPPEEAAAYAAELLDWYLPSRDPELHLQDIGVRCRSLTARVIVCLARHGGRIVSQDRILAYAYADRGLEQQPDTNAVAVKIHQARKALAAAGLPVEIQNAPGAGYRLIRRDGFLFPWEVA